MTRPTPAVRQALDAIRTLVDSARSLQHAAHRDGLRRTAAQAGHIARTLDAARTCLVQEGADYLPEAEAFTIAAEQQLLDIAVRISGVTTHA